MASATLTRTPVVMLDGQPVLEVTPRRAASLLSLSYHTITRWIRQGKLPARRLPGGDLRIAVSDLLALGAPVEVTR